MKNFILTACAVFAFITFANGQIIPSYVPTSGLVAWWPFNGNATDESINTNDGTVNGASLTTDRFGNINSAYYFSSAGCGTRIDATINTTSIITGLTISVWVLRVGNGCMGPRVLDFYNPGPGRLDIGWDNTGFGNIGSVTSTSAIIATAWTKPLNNVWTNLIYTNNGSFGKFYQDGVLFSTIASTGNPILSGNAAFGRMNSPAYDAFNGKLDDIAIWNRVLTSCEVQQLYTSSLNTFTFAAVSSSSTICKGQSTTLVASGASSYTWQPMSVVNSTNSVSPLSTSLYTVVATNTAGCTSTKTISILVNPTPTITVNSGTICLGNTFSILPSGASSYTYSSGSSLVSPTLTTTYSVTGTNTLGCVSQSPSTLTVFVSPCTGIDELEYNQSIIFYPNPFTNEIYFNTESDIINKKYFIYNTSGQVIESGILNGNKINCFDFSKGLYLIKLEGSAKTYKLMKEN
jgi:hypothetical protein